MAEANCVLALDLGTSSCKARIVDATGQSLGSASVAYPTLHPKSQWAQQDPLLWLDAACKATRKSLAAAHISGARIVGIGLTSAAHIAVLLDSHQRPVRHAILWNDQRSTEEVRHLERIAGEDILRITYQAVSTSWSLPHLAWIRKHDRAAWQRTRQIVLSKDYLCGWLTGCFRTDPATALSSQLFDPGQNEWSSELCSLIGIKNSMLPDVTSATKQAGALRPEAARMLDLRAGIPVITGTLDSATELLAAGATAPGNGMARLASAGGVQIITRKPTADRGRITYPFMIDNHWYCQGGTNCCAAAVEWARNLIDVHGAVSFERWDQLAAQSPAGAEGLLFHPYLAGERAPYWRSDLRGSFTGLTLGHQQSHLARAVYEGTAFSIRDALSVLPAGRNRPASLSVAGGGAKSATWTRILADVLEMDLCIIPDCDSSYGAAMLALVGCGLHQDLNQLAKRQHQRGKMIRHQARRSLLYRKLFKIYKQRALLFCSSLNAHYNT